MEQCELRAQVDGYCDSQRELTTIYDEYAKSQGLSYTSLHVLFIIFSNREDCTQKIICRQAFLPKQTVNAIITAFLKQGIVTLKEMDADRRNKIISLTDSGKEYVEKIILKIRRAEYDAMEKLTPGQRAELIENTKRFKGYFLECMKRND